MRGHGRAGEPLEGREGYGVEGRGVAKARQEEWKLGQGG